MTPEERNQEMQLRNQEMQLRNEEKKKKREEERLKQKKIRDEEKAKKAEELKLLKQQQAVVRVPLNSIFSKLIAQYNCLKDFYIRNFSKPPHVNIPNGTQF